MGKLFVVGIPAHNPDDVTLRALRILRQANFIVARDVSRTRRLLARWNIDRANADFIALDAALGALSGGSVALLSGAEGIAHPERKLIKAAAERGFDIVSVPGPSAMVTALVISGLPADAYVSLGFLPPHAAERRRLLSALATERRTLLALEAAERLTATLRDLLETLGDRPLALSLLRDVASKSVWRGTVGEALAHFEASPPDDARALVVGGASEEAARWPEERVRAEMARLLADGLRRKTAARRVARASGWRTREVYDLTL
jgi:16S rRNA (cytidine1402-2'-O)-methyltransferase